MRISIVGAGYVGLVTAACLAEWGHEIVVADVDRARVDAVNRGSSPIHEVGLGELIERHVGGRLVATDDVAAAVGRTELTFIGVGTPSTSDGIDLSAVVAASHAIGAAIGAKHEFHTVVVKSTVVPGTTAGPVADALEASSGRQVGGGLGLGVNPEFLTEGRAVADFLGPDRIVLGADDDRTHATLEAIYASVDPRVPRLLTNTRTAEMIKYASNALLATAISFSNEIANLCTAVGGVDVVDVLRGVHASDYLSPQLADGGRVTAPIASFFEAGCGFGGSCLPKDVRALIAEGHRHGVDMRVLDAVLATNEGRAAELVRLLESELGDLSGRTVTILGIAFKPDTDDVRESPALPVARLLLERGADVTLHDPVVDRLPAELADSRARLVGDLAGGIDGAEALVLVTRWDEYGELPALLAGRDSQPLVVDGRRTVAPDDVERYVGIGRG